MNLGQGTYDFPAGTQLLCVACKAVLATSKSGHNRGEVCMVEQFEWVGPKPEPGALMKCTVCGECGTQHGPIVRTPDGLMIAT